MSAFFYDWLRSGPEGEGHSFMELERELFPIHETGKLWSGRGAERWRRGAEA